MITETLSLEALFALSSRNGCTHPGCFPPLPLPLSAVATIGAASASAVTTIVTRPRPPLPQRTLERESPPRLPVPQSALPRAPCGLDPRSFVCCIQSPFSAPRRGPQNRSENRKGLNVRPARGGAITCPGERAPKITRPRDF